MVIALRLIPLLAFAPLLACGDRSDRQYEPPILADRIFTASANGVEAFAYITREDRIRPGPTRLSRRFERYTLYVRRLPDGEIVRELPMGDILNAMEDSTPRIIGVADGVIWIQRDSVEGYRVPSLEPVLHSANARADDASTAALRAEIARFISRPFWERPGSARLFTQVSNGLMPFERGSRLESLGLTQAGVLMRADQSAWLVNEPASVLVMSGEADSTWSMSRVTLNGERRWTTPLALRFELALVVLDAATQVVFMDSQSQADRSGVRDRVAWVNVATGEMRVLEIADGTVSVVGLPGSGPTN